jgi:hypothetical protein
MPDENFTQKINKSVPRRNGRHFLAVGARRPFGCGRFAQC